MSIRLIIKDGLVINRESLTIEFKKTFTLRILKLTLKQFVLLLITKVEK